MRHSPALFTAVLLLLFLGGINVAHGDDKLTLEDLCKIRPPGGIAAIGDTFTEAGKTELRKRGDAAPKEELAKWVVELERITDTKLNSIAKSACGFYFTNKMGVAFEQVFDGTKLNPKWNAKTADNLFQRARTMPPSEAKAWKEAFEALLKREFDEPYFAVPILLIPVEALHETQKYSVERGKKYRARMRQLTADDLLLWKDKVDRFEGTTLDAAVNIILLDDYFDKENFQRDKFKAVILESKK